MSVRDEIANKVSELSRENLTLRNKLEEFEKSQDKKIDEIFCEFLTVLDTFDRAEQTIKERELDKRLWAYLKSIMYRKLNLRTTNQLKSFVKWQIQSQTQVERLVISCL